MVTNTTHFWLDRERERNPSLCGVVTRHSPKEE
jgi:hypothetical protein